MRELQFTEWEKYFLNFSEGIFWLYAVQGCKYTFTIIYSLVLGESLVMEHTRPERKLKSFIANTSRQSKEHNQSLDNNQ